MKVYVKKIKRDDLRATGHPLGLKMAGYYRHGENPYKYLTQGEIDSQIKIHLKLESKLMDLNEEDLKNISDMTDFEKRKSYGKKLNPKWVVKYSDEDGTHEATFPSQKKADEWIRFQESTISSGEKFEVIELKNIL